MAAIVIPAVELAFSDSLSANTYGRLDPLWREPDMTFGSDIGSGPITRVVAQTVEGTGAAVVLPSYTDVFYNNIFLIPQQIDLGAVVAETQRTFAIWNAYLSAVSLEAVNVSGADGISLSNPTPPPATYLPLQYTQFSVTAGTDGPAIIDARYDFEFDVGTSQLQVSGIRAEIWDFLPNWQAGYKITYEYKTEIIKTRSGREQRRALRQTPRKSLEFEVAAKHDKMLRLRALFDAWQDKSFIAPELTKSVTTPNGVAANSDAMSVDEVPPWLQADAVIVLRDGDRHGLRVVKSIDGNDVEFTNSTPEAWPAGTLVHPGLTGRVENSQSTAHLTSVVAQLDFRYRVMPGSETIDDGTPFELYNGSELFLKKPNWASPPSIMFQTEVEEIDYGRGLANYLPLLTFGRRVVQATFLSRSRQEALEIEQFFHRLKGQRGSFYMPTWEPDISVAQTLNPLAHLMTASGTDLLKYYGTSSVFKHVMVRLLDGTNLLRPVLNMTAQDGNTVIDVGENWPREILPEEVLMVCWVPRWRLASDILTLEWLTDHVAQFQIAMQTLEDEQ